MLRARLNVSVLLLLASGIFQIALPALTIPPGAEEQDFFEKKIRPVLVERCYKCHSAEAEKLKGNLRLDTKEGVLKGGESGKPAIVPGDAEKSLLVEAIRYNNEDLQMPPKKSGGRLTDLQIADIIDWINRGAPDPRTSQSEIRNPKSESKPFWSFQRPVQPDLPQVRNGHWPKTAVDRFILAKLEAKGLQPSSPADKRTLIRRATFDLTGLPPTYAEVQSFIQDQSPLAFDRVVDRLLSSPRYGERWGRYWLDVARYADTKGYVYTDREEGRFVHSYAYRDWVIRALNNDMPYDQFLRLQIAADQIVDTNHPADLAAMGFLTLGRRFLGVVHDIIDDRIDTVMRGTQGLTVGCARCHDHKFDPIPTKDYYSLYGVFNACAEKALPLATRPEPTEAYLQYEKGLHEREDKLNRTFKRKCDELSDRLRGQSVEYLVAVLGVARLPSEEFYVIRGPKDLNPTIVRQWDAYLTQTKKSFHPIFAPWREFEKMPSKDFSARAAEVIHSFASLTNHPATDSGKRLNPLVAQAFATNPPASMEDVARRYGELLVRAHDSWRDWIEQADEAGQIAPPTLPDPDQEELRQVLYGEDAPVLVPKGAIVDLEWFFDEGGRVELAKLQSEIDRWIIKSPASPPHAVILEDRPTRQNPRVFIRGNPANKGDEVPRQFLKVLAGENRKPFTTGSGRLELADAIASRDNPLTARVMVNRVWLHHFGAGLVRTPSDFGTRSEPPTHPELLDWLAVHFMNNGWSLKDLHRLIMLSSVYQQSSDADSQSDRDSAQLSKQSPAQIDPENRLLWRFNRRRLDFESMRDSLLLVTGGLDQTMGGKPDELFKQPPSDRRTVYGFIDRQFIPGVLRVFDFANPDMHSPQRLDTTVPQQALFFMNSPFVTGRAKALNEAFENNGKQNIESEIVNLYRAVYQRAPTRGQIEAGKTFLHAAAALPLPVRPKPIEPVWRYGYGRYDDSAQRLEAFHPMPYFATEAWQGGPDWPDPKLGWARLTAEGGHAGNDSDHAAVRRWVSPADGKVSINAELRHEHEGGDGIAARIVSSRTGTLGTWMIHNDKAETKIESAEVRKGDTLDFIVDCRANFAHDDFAWAPKIKRVAQANTETTSSDVREWNAAKDFTGPPEEPPGPLTPWEQYAQVLLLSNEFMFVD